MLALMKNIFFFLLAKPHKRKHFPEKQYLDTSVYFYKGLVIGSKHSTNDLAGV